MTPDLLSGSASLQSISFLFPRDANPSRQQRLSHVIRMGQIQYGITQQHQQLFVIALKDSAQWLLTSFNHYSVSDPLPELRLRGPKLFSITTND
jgi:hypothetical protein